MSSPLFNAFNQGNNLNNFQRLLSQFQQFKASFQGDPKAEVERLLQSGRMSQQQLDQLQEMAKQFQAFMK